MPTLDQDKTKQVLGLLETQVKNLESLVHAMNFQILGNADQLVFHLCNSDEFKFPVETQDHIKRAGEEFLKSPVRRQVGRIKNCLASAQEALRVIKSS